MATILPFPGFRPRRDLASHIAALPYDVYNREEACREIEKEPLSFLRIDRAETGFPMNVGTYDDCVYERARDILWGMIQEGQFIQDPESCYYIYELCTKTHSQTGIVACASIDDYQDQVIKKHETTRKDKEMDRIRHVDVCDMQTGPIFLTYRADKRIDQIVEEKKQEAPEYDFTAPDGVRHRVWVIGEQEKKEAIQEIFWEVPDLYIADGHHRAASAVKAGLKRRKECPGYTGEEAFNYFLSVLFPHDQLQILDYNRVVKDLNGLTKDEFLRQVEKSFDVKELKAEDRHPKEKGTVAMFLDETWYLLSIKKELVPDDPVDSLDVALLQEHLIGPILGIWDLKTDKRIGFVGGVRGIQELERRVHEDCAVAFAMHPTSIEELFAVADAGRLMPPKSTWFEPKPRSGLFLHTISSKAYPPFKA
ncbi:MAG: DUF1015 domain-containing protein [Lachnospiraceae bacterium]|jgi:uncharacterized protein (DUF1015 family)